MVRLLFFFLAGSIAMLSRFFILGKFEWEQLLSLLLFPVGSLIVWLIHRRMLRRDEQYQPPQAADYWNTRIGERSSTGKKMLYKDTQKIGEYRRFYQRWWQYWVNGIVEGDGKWYMNLSFELADGETVRFIEQKKQKKLAMNERWLIERNGQVIGQAKTDYSFQNAVKLQEGLILEINDTPYYFRSFGIGSHTEVLLGDQVIASGRRSDVIQPHYQFKVGGGYEEMEPVLAMTYILFQYVHRQ